MSAAPAVTAKALEAGDVSGPAADAVSVRLEPAVLIVIPVNVARPEASVFAVAPETIEPAEIASVTGKLLLATALPLASVTWTVTAGVIATPADTTDGCCTNASLFAIPGVTSNADDGADVAAPDVAVSISPVATVLILVTANVATPELFVFAVRPWETDDGEPDKVTVAPLTGLLNPSFATTVNEAMFAPATTLVGCVPNAKVLTAPAVTSNGEDALLESDGLVDDAVKVMPLPTALIVIPLKVARPEELVLAVLPASIEPADGAKATSTPLVATALPNVSWICTVTAGDIAAPAPTDVGP